MPDTTETAEPAPEFFRVGHTYRHPPGHVGDERFLVEHIATAPADFHSKLEPGPVAFGWINARRKDGNEVRFGAYNLDDFTGWELDPDTEIRPRYAYRAEYSGIPLGTYVDRATAEQHCETDLYADGKPDGRTLTWVPFDHAPDESELCIGDDLESTDYTITAVEQLTAYDPEAEN